MKIDVWSDLVCPWCFVGKRRLEQALAGRKDVEIVWRPFELNPGMAKGGVPRAEYRKAKFGSLERSRELEARVLEAGRSVGIDFAFDRIERTPNTFDGHRLLWFARGKGRQDQTAEALFRAYFLEGKDVGDRDVLVRAAEEAGLDAAEVGRFLAGPDGTKEVREEETEGFQVGVQGVPFFVFAESVALSGAHEPETIREAMAAAATRGA